MGLACLYVGLGVARCVLCLHDFMAEWCTGALVA
jgi:hypothetical protein